MHPNKCPLPPKHVHTPTKMILVLLFLLDPNPIHQLRPNHLLPLLFFLPTPPPLPILPWKPPPLPPRPLPPPPPHSLNNRIKPSLDILLTPRQCLYINLLLAPKQTHD